MHSRAGCLLSLWGWFWMSCILSAGEQVAAGGSVKTGLIQCCLWPHWGFLAPPSGSPVQGKDLWVGADPP